MDANTLRRSLGLILFFIVTCASAPIWADVKVVVASSKSSPILPKIVAGIKTDYPNWQVSISTPGNAKSVENTYIIAAGKGAVAHLDATKSLGSVRVLLPKALADQQNDQSAVYIEPPLLRQAYLAHLLLSGVDPLGFLVSSEAAKTSALKTLARFPELKSNVVVLKDGNLNQGLSKVLRNSRLLVGTYDTAIYNPANIKNILITSYRQHKVLIGPSKSYLKAGSYATTFSNLNDIASRAAAIISHHQKQKKWLHADYNPHYQILFNQQVTSCM